MLALDSLVLDLIFQSGAQIEPETLVEALGGQDVLQARTAIDPDMQDPRFEMELSPSMPFRRRGERRLLLCDDSVAPMRQDPQADPIVPVDLREEKDRLIAVCETGDVRFGRIFALGSWGDAVWVASSARDLRAIALLPWVLDPTVDVDGKKRAARLTQAEFEEKILAYEKRLDELDENAMLKNLGPANFERRGDLLVVDVLENDGTWDLRKSLALEQSMAAIDQFALIPGAPVAEGAGKEPKQAARTAPAPESLERAPAPAPEPAPEPAGPPLRAADVGDRLVVVFPAERFDLDVAAALGKRDWESVLRSSDLAGPERDRVFRHGAGFLAPLEFLSEVFVDGVPLSKPTFESGAAAVGDGVRALEVHFPRFGPVLLLDVAGRGRFVCSERAQPEQLLPLLAELG